MKIFAKFGELILKLFDLIGALILEIPNIPDRIRRIDTKNIKDKVSKVSYDVKSVREFKKEEVKETTKTELVKPEIEIIRTFTPQEKESTIFRLQIISAVFLVISILHIFNFLSFIVYVLAGSLLVLYLIYILFSKVKLMYAEDFNAYRDFFLMYIAVGVILVLVSSNVHFTMAFPFEFLPSLSVLIFAIIAVFAVFLIFRIRYHRNYTYGQVIESGEKTAYVRVDYDICSNVKPDIYLVENEVGASEGERVKLQIEEKFLSTGGSRPVRIIEVKK